MSYSLVYSAKPHSTHTIRVHEPEQDSAYVKSLRACSNLIDAIFAVKAHYRPSKRLHIKGKKYMYIPSDAHQMLLVRFKNFDK
jgi:hypothetical protein